MSAENYRLACEFARAQNRAADVMRGLMREMQQAGLSVEDGLKLLDDARRNVAQVYALADALPVDPSLGAWEKAGKRCPPDLAEAVDSLLGSKGGR